MSAYLLLCMDKLRILCEPLNTVSSWNVRLPGALARMHR